MAQEDPLHIPESSDSVEVQITHKNPRGRPALSNSITFCSQPKSIVSKLLSNISKNLKTIPKASCINIESEVSYSTLQANSNSFESNDHGIIGTDDINSDYTAPSPKLTEDESNDDNISKCKKKRKVKKAHRTLKSTKIKVKTTTNPKEHSNCYSDRCDDLPQGKPKDDHHCCDHAGCNYKSKLLTNLTKHKRLHSNAKPYMCDQCPFRSNYVNSLKVHRRIHTTERPYCCHQCGYTCNSTSNLKKHFLHKHEGTLKDTK